MQVFLDFLVDFLVTVELTSGYTFHLRKEVSKILNANRAKFLSKKVPSDKDAPLMHRATKMRVAFSRKRESARVLASE